MRTYVSLAVGNEKRSVSGPCITLQGVQNTVIGAASPFTVHRRWATKFLAPPLVLNVSCFVLGAILPQSLSAFCRSFETASCPFNASSRSFNGLLRLKRSLIDPS